MEAPSDYSNFIRRVRMGDERAAEELVRRYEPEIRLEIRSWLRMRDPRLRRVFDSMDICQSVMADFFARSALGDFDLDEPSQLIRLLVGMARNKVAERVRFHTRQRRDVRIVGELGAEASHPSTEVDRPSRIVSGRELLDKFRGLLSVDERALVDLRSRGDDWATIAAALGGTAEGRRKQFARALARVSGGFELD